MLGSSVVNGLSGQPRLIILLLVLVGEPDTIFLQLQPLHNSYMSHGPRNMYIPN